MDTLWITYISGWWWLEHDFFFHIFGNNDPNWRTHIFQRSWNYQPELVLVGYINKLRTEGIKGHHPVSLVSISELIDLFNNECHPSSTHWWVAIVLTWMAIMGVQISSRTLILFLQQFLWELHLYLPYRSSWCPIRFRLDLLGIVRFLMNNSDIP